ncbi:MAG TPA: DNA topoisomerase I [Methylomirabilota bacterium]|nr:DNA topoisomerase I [Methylomirabilota bacterium]
MTSSTTLVVTEKPDAAVHIAEALSGGSRPKKLNVQGVPFFEVFGRDGRILVCSALGHLYAVGAETKGRSHYPVWNFSWKPKHLVERGQLRQERWIRAISEVSRQADRFVNACDYDLEGSLIGYTILKYACNGAEDNARRMKFSTLTSKELREAYSKLAPHLDFALVQAGMCRHEVDWLYGINLSRALTQSALKASHRYVTLSTGRVQGPTLSFVIERERAIQCFVPVPYWVVKTTVNIDGKTVEAELEQGRVTSKQEAKKIVDECTDKVGVVEKIESHNYDLPPPTPFDLSALQAEAYRHFRLTPRNALAIAEHLYLDQLISYPRTSSQKLPPSIGYEEILTGLSRLESYRIETARLLAIRQLTPHEGNKHDPAHPAVYPTGNPSRKTMDQREGEIFDLIVRRFLATFGETAIRQSNEAVIQVGSHRFVVRASHILKKGWMEVYGRYAKSDQTSLPALREGQQIPVEEIHFEEKYTQPPPRYNPGSLLKSMEEVQLGTKATRADIIQTLYDRGYVRDKHQTIEVTPLAFRVHEILEEYCPKITDVGFTRELESKIEQIELGRETKRDVVQATVDYLKPVLEDLKTKEREIGVALSSIFGMMWLDKATLTVPCPKCGQTLIWITGSNGKRFIGHKVRAECSFSLPLPPTHMAKVDFIQRRCPTCGFQLMRVKWTTRQRSRPITSCPSCYVNRSRDNEITVDSSIQTRKHARA